MILEKLERGLVALERIAAALEILSGPEETTVVGQITNWQRFGVYEAHSGDIVGAFDRLTVYRREEARTFDVDLYVKHPTDDRETDRGRILLSKIEKVLRAAPCFPEHNIGKYVYIIYRRGQIVGFGAHRFEERRIPPPDDVEDIAEAQAEYNALRASGEVP